MALAKLIPSRKINSIEKNKYDPSFLAKIQPQGGVKFADNFVKKGDGYETCIHLYEYPKYVDDKWLKSITTMNNVVCIIDVSTMDKSETTTNINKSLLEQTMRLSNEKKGTGQMDAVQSRDELINLYQQISQMGEVIKLVHVRLYAHAKTAPELEKKVADILTELESTGYKGTVFLNEQEYEWKSMFSTYTEQVSYLNHREGKGIPGITLAGGLPFHFSELNDPRGSYLGTTFTGGSVLFDLFHKDKKRRYYNAVLIGLMGAGKSTSTKKLLVDNAVRDNFIRGFDVTGEYEPLIKDMNGKIIALDGTDGLINSLQIYRSHIDENKDLTFAEVEYHSFLQHLSKVAIFYRYLAPQSSDADIMHFKKVLREFYESLGFLEKINTTGVTTLKNHEYPTYSDLLQYVQRELYEDIEQRRFRTNLSPDSKSRLEKIELVLDGIVNSYGHLFNGHTTIDDVTNEQIVFFSIKSLRSLEKEVFNAQFYNAFRMIWDNLIKIGEPQRKAIYQNGFDFDAVRRFLVLIDESHLVINPDNMLAVNALTEYAREARKYFGGLVFASQSIRDFVPEGTSSEVISKIKTLFELTQYKFIMQQDANSLETLRQVFQGQLSESELFEIPLLEQGRCILSINGVQNIMMTVEATVDELMLFEGGL
ncbi:VirB4 family type IV secretion system protein [Paenibacillus larvae]|uniref:Conjugal transfer ATP-binding protein TraC n=1 Tax=Paenibacillus larvae subsp. larvae TaxID=147375 RepID=A0A2L1U7D1_9BACL|nr:type IV secretion system protein VirB4 [Paenibacillus larvae]AVF28836.1 conjugal transfer ATP-binding protein TraC [Paenibacillus larvae subsp. larvae]MCY9500298.1 type IV secretion system protein VirB4 [Paenibacillus larvae]MDR5608734.1 type IV secretion system protein VirB4 [Paenibacillus larvae]